MRHRTTGGITDPIVSATYVRAAIVALAPLVLLAAFAYHPHIIMLPDAEAVAHAVHADTTRWAIAHWTLAIGCALMAAAFVYVREYLRDAGDDRWSALALPLLVFASAVYAILPGMEFTVLAAARTGGDVVATQGAIEQWFKPTMALSGVVNAVGLFFLAKAILRSDALREGPRGLVVVALGVMAVSRLVPVGPVHFYVQGIAAVVALWPIALDIARQASARRPRELEGVLAR